MGFKCSGIKVVGGTVLPKGIDFLLHQICPDLVARLRISKISSDIFTGL